MKNRVFLSLIYFVFVNSISYGQLSATIIPEKSYINTTELNQKLDSIFKPFQTKNSPGCAITILYKGKSIAKKTYGMASIELQVPFSHESVVSIGYSEAREFISIAAVLMEKDGIFSLNDKVKTFFPKLPNWSDPVTPWDLLNHRSGFVDEWSTLLLMHGSMSNRFDKEQFFKLLYTQPEPEIEPGIGYMYCNSDFGLLRLIMEKASGRNLDDWIKQRIFDPLKMNNTRMQKSALDIVPNRAAKYEFEGDRFKHDNVQKTSPGGNYFILTCANDLEKWTVALNDPSSGVHVAFKKLRENVRMIPGKKNHYATGHSVDTINNQEVILHEGVNGENYLSRIPSKELTIITLGNLDGESFSSQNKLIRNYVLNAKEPAFVKPVFVINPIQIEETALKKYQGKYRWLNQVSWQSFNELRKFSDFFLEQGKLKSRYNGNYIIELIPVGPDLFYSEEADYGVQMRFIKTGENGAMSVTIEYDDGFPGETMEKEVTPEWLPTPEDLKGFAGSYYSKHLDYYWNFNVNEQGKLVLKRATMPDAIIIPDGENQFHYIAEKNPGDGFDQWITFNKNASGEIDGLTVWSARVMHHRFDKK